MTEKRKYKRIEARLFAEVVMFPEGIPRGRAVVTDASIGGVALDSETDLSIGDLIECTIEVPLVFQAKVIRKVSGGQVKKYGIKFIHQGFLDRMLIKKMFKGSLKTKRVSL